MVQLTVRVSSRTGRAQQLVQALRTLTRQAVMNRACSAAHVAADVDEPNVFWYSEDWQEAEALETQLRTRRFSHLLDLLENAPVAPLLEFRVVSEIRGLDYLAAVREGGERLEVDEADPEVLTPRIGEP